MEVNQWTVAVNKTCPECKKDRLFLDWSGQDQDVYVCSNCNRRIEIEYERMPSRIVLIKDDQDDPDVEKEYWSR